MFAFQVLLTLLVLVMCVVAQLWAWLASSDERGLAASSNAALVTYFVAGSWVVIVATLFLSPRLL
jgi:hypothetical protein